jgi:hypothetical protein
MPIWGRAVKTTVEVSDDLYRRAKSEAAPVVCTRAASQAPTLRDNPIELG